MRLSTTPTIHEIYSEITAFANERIYGIGGPWWDRPYKGDFFRIFSTAFQNGYCQPLACAPKSKYGVAPEEFHINGDILGSYLRREWLGGDPPSEECQKMIEDLTVWWDEWTYAWRNHPNKPKRRSARAAK